MKLAAAARPAKLDVRSLTKANLDASGVADASPLSARSKLRRFASTSDLPPAIQPPRMKKRHSIAVSADDDFADYHSHNLRHVDALHGDLLFLGNFVCSQACARVVASSSVLLNLVLTTMRFAAIVLSATVLAKADAPRAGASLWGGAVLVSAGVIAFATSPPPMKERSRKAHVSDPIPEEEA